MPYFDRDGIKIFYIDEPGEDTSKPPVLLIHGWTCDVTDWVFQMPFLEAHGFRRIAIDLRGHGGSAAIAPGDTWDNLDMRPDTLVDDVAALLSHLNISVPVLIMGHSSGGIYASAFAVRYPDLTRALVAIDPPYFVSRELNVKMVASLRDPKSMNPSFRSNHDLPTHYFKSPANSPNYPKWLLDWYAMRRQRMEEVVITKMIDSLSVQDEPRNVGAWETAQTYFKNSRKCPRLVIVKSEDRIDLEKGLGMGSQDQIVCMNDGHWMHHSKPEEFNAVLEQWLKSIGLLV